MKYSSGLAKKEREDIFKLFTENRRLKFNEIEKYIKIRSNMVSYHIEQMQKEGLLQKKDEYYFLTKDAEKYLPILSHLVGKEMSPLPVVLVALINKDKILLIQRKKRPYRNYWSMIGGKILLEESIQEAAKRHIEEKTKINADFKSINSTLHERVLDDDLVKHSFILLFIEMTTKETAFKESAHGKLKWVKISDVDNEKIIPSDLWLIKNKLNKKTDYNSAFMNENEEELTSFKIIK